MPFPFAHIRVVLLLGLMAPAALYGQQRDVTFEHVTVEHGLSANTVRAILQDSKGFLWIATPDGLNRYDGYHFTQYKNDPLDSTSLVHNWIYTLYEAPSEPGVLWVGTRNGLDRFDSATGVFTHFRHQPDNPHSLSDNSILALYEDRAGVFWVGTNQGGLNRFNRATGVFTRYQYDPGNPRGVSDKSVNALYEDHAGVFWVGTDNGLQRMDRETGIFTRYSYYFQLPNMTGDGITALYEDASGTFWIGTNDGLFLFDRQTSRFARHPSVEEYFWNVKDKEITTLYEDRTGRLWIGTVSSGMYRLDPATYTVTRYAPEDNNPGSLSSSFINAVYEDPAGVFWIGTTSGGLNKFDRVRSVFTQYQHEAGNANSLSENHVRAVYQASSEPGVLWIGTESSGLVRFDRAAGTFTPYRRQGDNSNSLSGDDITVIYEAPSEPGVLWVVPYGAGLNRVDLATGVVTRYRRTRGNTQSLLHNIVRAVYEDADGQLWVGTKEGLARLDRATGLFAHYRHEAGNPNSLIARNVRLLYEAPSEPGVLWIGTDGGLDRYDQAGDVFTHYRHEAGNPQSLSYDGIRALYEDAAGTLWIGTRGGLNRFDRATETFTWYTEQDGLASNVVMNIVADDDGHLWLGTAKGISKFDPATETFRNYDTDDGLLNPAYEVNTLISAQNGDMIAGGINGLDVFRPGSVRDNDHVPLLVITAFLQYGNAVDFGADISEITEIELSYRENFFAFEFAALDFVDPQKNQYAYRLDGLEDDWTYAGTQRTASYTNLDPGSYRFRVKGSNNNGLWNEEGASVRVIITPPVWMRWWFIVLSVLLGIGLLLGVYRYRVRSITTRNRTLQKEIEERKRLEADRERLIAALEDKNVELEGKNDELEDKNAELERFTYTVSHDLKSPLVTIKGFLGLLQQNVAKGNTERMNRDIGQISSAADKMARLLAELLELSRIGRQMNPPEAVSLTELAQEAAHLVTGQIDARGVTVAIEPDMPVVYGDQVRLLEVYQNLIDNAVKFMGDQAAPRVEIAARTNDAEVLCSVQDNGMGIAPRYHEQVFGLFDRLEVEEEGTGIGLALVKRIVEVHGGRIWVESDGQGQGATFWFTLPRNGM